jgi:glycosyltransferase involved in cell wall biosynthesis
MVVINYNDKVRVKRAIESCLNQTYKDVEIIVVDDGSDNETRELYKDYNVKLIQLERDDKTARTPSRARNAGIKEATGEYICFLDSDNYFDELFVEECMKYPSDVMYVNWEIFGKTAQNVYIENAWNPNISILENYLTMTHLDHQCLLIKKSILDEVGIYDERLPRSQDCDLIVRLMLKTQDWKHIQKKLFFFENHEDDQMKMVASLHGKMLWALKLGINWEFLLKRIVKFPMGLLAVIKAYNDFTVEPEWKENFENSLYKPLIDEFNKQLNNERTE